MNLWSSLRSSSSFGMDEFLKWVALSGSAGNFWSTGLSTSMATEKEERPDGTFASMARAFMGNGVIFACEMARLNLFSEARFQYQRMEAGRPGDLYGTADLAILERPWTNATTGDLLNRALLWADIGGTGFMARSRGADRIRVLRPDWVVVAMGSRQQPGPNWQQGAEVIGYAYYEGGIETGKEPEVILPSEMAVFMPTPDPLRMYRGLPWTSALSNEIAADSAATSHKLKFFENAATPNMVVVLDKSIQPAAFGDWVKKLKEMEPKGDRAYKTMYLGAGADAKVVGSDLRQLEFKVTQGGGETRIAAAANVPPVIVGLSEGLAAATYSNYSQARRRFADLFARPAWRNFAGSLQVIVPTPAGSRLWYDDRDIPFLADDMKDRADVQAQNSNAIRTLVDAGFEPSSAVRAVMAGDLRLLVHTGLYSVQLQAPGVGDPTPARDLADLIAALTIRSGHVLPAGPPEARLRIEVGEAPIVNVEPPVVHVAPAEVNVPAPVVNVDTAPFARAVEALGERLSAEPPKRSVRKTVERNQIGQIVAVVEEES